MAMFYGKRHEKEAEEEEVKETIKESYRSWIYRDLRPRAVRYPKITDSSPSIPSIPFTISSFNDKDYIEIEDLSLNVDTRGRLSVTFYMKGSYLNTSNGTYSSNEEELSTINLDTAANPKIPATDGSNLTSCFPIDDKILIKDLVNYRDIKAIFIGFKLDMVIPVYGTNCNLNVRYVKHT